MVSSLESEVYEDLRKRLVDLTRRNRLLHFTHNRRSPIIRVVDEIADYVLERLRDGKRFRFKSLPEPEDEPGDERTAQFRAAVDAARATDQTYRKALDGIAPDDASASAKEARIERALRDRVRAKLGLPPRPDQRTIDPIEWAHKHGVDPAYELGDGNEPPAAKHTDECLHTLLFRDQLQSRLKKIAENARSVEQETGVSTLHLAFGFLEWFESDQSDEPLCSPLLLQPVALEKHKPRGGQDELRLTGTDSEPVTNLSLELRLRDFSLRLPSFDLKAAKPVDCYFRTVAETVRGFKRWRIRRYLTLGAFSFARIAMFRDLDPANWREAGHPAARSLIRPILRGISDEPAESLSRPLDEYEIDHPDIERVAPVLVHDADSSQHSAIVDAMQGKNLVIEGPPGTGKSQTIANLISNFLHQGKTILFVSEKMAALEVVKSRLDRKGLGQFCLPLHSTSARPAAVIEALQTRASAKLPFEISIKPLRVQAQNAKAQLKAHLDTLHAQAGLNGETVHTLIGRLAELGQMFPDFPQLLRSRIADLPASIDAGAHFAARVSLEALETIVADGGSDWNPRKSPFWILDRADLFPDEQEQLFEALEIAVNQCSELLRLSIDLSAKLGANFPGTLGGAESLSWQVASLRDPGPLVNRELLSRLAGPEEIEDGYWILQRAVDAEAGLEWLQRIGVDDPLRLNPTHLREIASLAARLGLENCQVGDMAAQSEAAAAEVERLKAYRATIDGLRSVLSLTEDPDLGSLRLACIAASLAAEVDMRWQEYRRPGLERHVDLLKRGATTQEVLETKRAQILERLDIAELSSGDLSSVAAALRRRGLAALFNFDVIRARRLFMSRWQGGRIPRRAGCALLLEQAAEVVAGLEHLADDRSLRDAVGIGGQFTAMPLALVALAAEWQSRVRDCLDANGIKGAQIAARLVMIDARSLARLSKMASTASQISAYLDMGGPAYNQTWTAIERLARVRSDAYRALLSAVSTIGLSRPSVQISQFSEIAETAEKWRTAADDLHSLRKRRVLNGLVPASELLRATVEFAADVQRMLPSAAPRLLKDSWTAAIIELRASAELVKKAADELKTTLYRLSRLGLKKLGDAGTEESLNVVASEAKQLKEASKELPSYLDHAKARSACVEQELARPIVEAFEQSEVPLRHLPEALDWLVCWAILRRKAEAHRAIFNRTGAELSVLRQNFASADRERLKSDAHSVAKAVLGRSIPPGSSVGSRREWTDYALLRKEFQKQQRHVPVRDLLSRAGDAVMSMTPCLMMSPLTVAQYLKPGRTFDVVIMDEASQIKPEDAIGALLRARQAVIVGDPKQLPPTNFFDRALDDSVDGEDEESDNGGQISEDDRVRAESILNIALQAFPTLRRLRWHYRSRHESLIAFSNREFYDNHLVVFPAPQPRSETLGIELVEVSGRRHERVNVEEAKIVAHAAAAFMREHKDLSFGIVAMNQPQRDEIQREIEQLTAGDAGANDYNEYWEERHEPPFVKNLENVQGDERDVIFISLGWGRTPEGAMHQRFSPVNREDGHRRLNVLLTRAKRKILLFSSLKPEDIVVDLSKTARGVRVLRDYLVYAIDGRLEGGHVVVRDADSPFETSVANALKARGHEVEMQVGVAGYRVDLAVRHPEHPSHFVLGIECDGATYHRAKSARDRDRLRQEALEQLRWRLTRVWSTDWFRDPGGQAERLSEEIRKAIAESRIAPVSNSRLVVQISTQDLPAEIDMGAICRSGTEHPVPNGEAPHEPVATPDSSPEEEADLTSLLRRFREEVIMRDLPGSEPQRCILRDEMIRAIVFAELDDPEEFHVKIPEWLRTKTDGRQMRYLDQICDIVAGFSRPRDLGRSDRVGRDLH